MLESYECEMLSYERKCDSLRNQIEESKEILGRKDGELRRQKILIKNLQEEAEQQKMLYHENYLLQKNNRELCRKISEEKIPKKLDNLSPPKKRRLVLSDSEEEEMVQQAFQDNL